MRIVPRKPLRSSASAFRRLCAVACDRRGVSAIEFALILPAVLLLYIGAVEISNGLTIDQRTHQVAATAADLTAQVRRVAKLDIRDINAAATSILDPYSTAPLKVVLSSVVANAQNKGRVEWSCANKGRARAEDSSHPVPPGLTEPNSSVIVAEVTYSYSPLLGLSEVFSPGTFDITRTFYTRPRQSTKVEKTDRGC